MSKIIVIQASLNRGSRTAIVAKEAEALLLEKAVQTETIDLRELKLEFADGRRIEDYGRDLKTVYRKLAVAKGFVLAFPVYSFSHSGVVKNFIDIVCGAMQGKFIGLIENSGGRLSYLAAAEMMKLLAFDFDITTVQPVVYTSSMSFDNGKLVDQKAFEKLDKMTDRLLEFVEKLSN